LHVRGTRVLVVKLKARYRFSFFHTIYPINFFSFRGLNLGFHPRSVKLFFGGSLRMQIRVRPSSLAALLPVHWATAEPSFGLPAGCRRRGGGRQGTGADARLRRLRRSLLVDWGGFSFDTKEKRITDEIKIRSRN
jgi:hypothetical protein